MFVHCVLSTSNQHCVDLSPMENYNFRWGPNFIESPSSLVHMFQTFWRHLSSFSSAVFRFARPPTCCSHAQDASPEFKLHSVLSTSNQHCVDLSPPWKNYNFRWGPNFIESPSSLVHMFQTFWRHHLVWVLKFSDLQQPPTCCSHAPDASPEFELQSALSNSGQRCVDLSPMKN